MRAVTLLFVGVSAWAAIGDNAPSVPAGYVTTHPRLGAPSNSYLTDVWAQRANASTSTGSKRFFDAADTFDTTNPTGSIALRNCRYLLLAYRASKVGGSPNSTYLDKIKALANPDGAWNVTTGNGNWSPGTCLAMAYDWVYDDLDTTTRTAMLARINLLLDNFETSYVDSGASPFNDRTYQTGFAQVPFMILALAAYPDDTTNGLRHLRWAMDTWFNLLLPAWKLTSGGEQCGASNDTDIDCGAGYHETWQGYFNQTSQPGQNQWWVSNNLAWKNATGDDVFTREGWLKNIAYWTMYITRPDGLQVKVNGAHTHGYNTSEYGTDGFGSLYMGSLEGLGKIYNDATIRGWARNISWNGATPWAFEPSAWPFLEPDTSSTTNTRSVLSKTRNFPGWGTLFFRTGWGESDTLVTLQYGDNFWSHPMFGVGSFTVFNRGSLVLNSGNYKPGSASEHFMMYASQTIAHNTILIENSAESFPNENRFWISRSDGSDDFVAFPNDLGGQVRHGSDFSISNGSSRVGPPSPPSPGDYIRGREFWHRSKLVGYAVGAGSKYSAAMIDMTAAYNNAWSHVPHVDYSRFTANSANRTYRARKAVRYLVFVPRGTAAYVITYDQVVSPVASYTKRALIHSVNEPVITGNKFEITRNELVTDRFSPADWMRKTWIRTNLITQCPGGCTSSSTQYQYDGKLTGWMTNPTGGTLTKVGGTGSEFSYGGTNYNECMAGLCPINQGTGDTSNRIKSVSADMPYEPGGWRIEETMDAARTSDNIVNVMLAAATGETNVVSTAPSTTTVGTNLVTTWKDNADACTYTLTLPIDGVGGHLAIAGTCVGSQTVDADLLATQTGTDVPAMTWTKVDAGGEKIGRVTGNVDFCTAIPHLLGFACLDNYRDTSSEPNLNWFLYSLEENKTFIYSDISKFQSVYWSEGGHPIGLPADPTNAQACGYMAHSGGQVSDMSKTTVCFDFLGRVGKNKRTASVPGYFANQMGCAFDTYRRKTVCWGGGADNGLKLNIYDPSANTWTMDAATTGTCPLPGLSAGGHAFNTHDGKVYVFGGRASDPTSALRNTLFTIDLSTSPATCAQLSPTGGPPEARIWHGWAYDEYRNKFVLNGGSNTGIAGSGNIYDTWIYDPEANTWTDVTATVGTPGTPNAPLEYRFAYLREMDTFVALPQGQLSTGATFYYYLRLAPGPKIGTRTISRAQTAGHYNVTDGAWASASSVAADATQTVKVHMEYGPFSLNAGLNDGTLHPYAANIVTGAAAKLPTSATYQSMIADIGAAKTDNVDPSVTLISGVPWACWSMQNTSVAALVYCKGYSGGSWSLGGQIGGTAFQGQTDIIGHQSKPTVIVRHNDRTTFSGVLPLSTVPRVFQYDAGSWAQVGDYLSNQTGITVARNALTATLASDNTNLYAAWTEYTAATAGSPSRITYTNTKAFLALWNGTSWAQQCGGAANISTASGWAESISVAILAGVPYVAFTERPSVSGNPRVYVRKCQSGTWSTVGTGYRNRDQTNGWVWTAKLIAHDGVLDLIWDEQGSSIPWNTNPSYEGSAAETVHVYSDRWNGSAWAKLGGALNADPTYSTATLPSIAYGNAPVAVWGEFKHGANRAIYAKQWDGSDWVAVSAVEPPSGGSASGSVKGKGRIVGKGRLQ
jgi:hypothetical protein